ncbi:hypothetical protein THAOC_07687 [Thalassiosira oceanica]|uniref:Uncharacterized protein n=1 Tax=Thalassiosira oceanica TaxID=159749 RepID=K0SZP9_THAOC|nr:hypothetical protein THAOC_07687 [Thalassiosira oceanica]|eukprot:EJK70915.1 hypothetical protein THAOC_07687 [Thalassiosira oceanica]
MGPRDGVPRPAPPLHAAAALLLLPALFLPADARRVGIVGGGISGTFAARYLAGHDAGGGGRGKCALDEIVVFDVSPPPGSDPEAAGGPLIRSSSDPRPPTRQGPRVASVTLADGSTVELGASIVYGGNRLVVEMMDGDPENLERGEPMNTGKRDPEDGSEEEPSGLGIYDGEGRWALDTASLFPYLPRPLRRIAVPLYTLWRYNLDYLRLRRAVADAVASFEHIYAMLNDTSSDVTYFPGPAEMWEAVGLDGPSRVSYGDLLDALGVSRCDGPRLPGAGMPPGRAPGGHDDQHVRAGPGRDERPRRAGVSRARGGGALQRRRGEPQADGVGQARRSYDGSDCGPDGGGGDRVRWHTATVGSVVGTEDTLDVYSEDGDLLGQFDAVILATPLQQARIDFLVESPGGLDGSVLHPMPLAGLHPNLDPDDDGERGGEGGGGEGRRSESNEHGRRLFAPPSPRRDRPLRRLRRHHRRQQRHVQRVAPRPSPAGPWPRTILVTARGRDLEGISTLTILSKARGLVKTFSTRELGLEKRTELFGPDHVVEYEQAWGGRDSGRHGGSVPSFAGGRPRDDSMPYLLYDGGSHWGRAGGDGDSGSPRRRHAGPALYYANAVEGSAAAIEISAIGARSVAKLLARRLGMIGPGSGGGGEGRDEL